MSTGAYPAMEAAGRDALLGAIRQSWSGDTSACPDWTPAQPSTGQCAVSALVIQDYLGGVLVRATVNGTSHYWNRLPDGEALDLTRDQFPDFDPVGTTQRSRDYALSFPRTRERYQVLQERVRDRLGGRPALPVLVALDD